VREHNSEDILRAMGLTPEILKQMGMTAHVVFGNQQLQNEPVVVGEMEDSEIFTQKALIVRSKEINRELDELRLKKDQIAHDLEQLNLSIVKRLGLVREDLISTTLDNKIVVYKSAAIREGLPYSKHSS